MTYSLNTLNPRRPPTRARPALEAWPALPRKLRWCWGSLALVFWLLALVSLLGAGRSLVHLWCRWAGAQLGRALGAWLADASSLPAGLSPSGGALPRACGPGWHAGALDARALGPACGRCHRVAPHAPRASGSGWLLLVASTALEWSRLYRFEARLPGHAGGVLGYLGGPTGCAVAGFHRLGSGLDRADGAGRGAGVPVFLEPGGRAQVGAWIDGLVESRREKREIAQDLALGSSAAREREEVCTKSAVKSRSTTPRRS
jgi:S-DNA-T family DNA segregation ATPase FtsK/SpoIIIE